MTATLKRKLAGEHRDTAAPKMTALRALRLSVARTSEDLFGLALAVAGGGQGRALPDELEPLLSDEDLLIVLDCPRGLTGAAVLSLPLVAALIQQQTMGRVSDRPVETRDYTDTDAVLVSPLVEGVLERASDLVQETLDRDCFQSVRFGARAEDARSLLLSLRAERYRTFTLPIDVALGRHQAKMVLVLPDDDDRHAEITQNGPEPAERAAKSPFLGVETDLRAVLARFRLSVSELNALSVGDTLPLPRDRLDDTALVTLTDRVIARGKLGQMNGHRAVRLMAAPPVPKVGHPAGFDPQITKQAMMGANEPPAHGSADQVEASVLDLEPSDLSSLSTDEAVDQISALAGLTAGDVAAVHATPLSETRENAQLPTVLPDPEAGSEGSTDT